MPESRSISNAKRVNTSVYLNINAQLTESPNVTSDRIREAVLGNLQQYLPIKDCLIEVEEGSIRVTAILFGLATFISTVADYPDFKKGLTDIKKDVMSVYTNVLKLQKKAAQETQRTILEVVGALPEDIETKERRYGSLGRLRWVLRRYKKGKITKKEALAELVDILDELSLDPDRKTISKFIVEVIESEIGAIDWNKLEKDLKKVGHKL